MEISNRELFIDRNFINGQWISHQDGKEFSVTNPANGELIIKVPDMGANEAKAAIEAAEKALPDWKKRTAKNRAIILRRWFDLIIENQEDLAIIMTMEQGKPLTESRGEIAYGASFMEWFAEEGKRIYGDTIPTNAPDRRILVIKEPIGVVAAITPWNFPSAMIARKAAPALAAGCTFVLKPAKYTPLSALALAFLGEKAGLPPGVFNIITSSKAGEIGQEFCQNKAVRKLSFTGSTEVGKKLMQDCAETVKKVSMELGGNAPFIVFDDADIDEAVKGAVISKYRNTGQTCVCTNRFIIQDKVYDEFAEKLTQAVLTLKIGAGLSEDVQQGPLINKQSLEKVEQIVKDALDRGAQLLCGGKRHKLGGTFYEPTILKDVNQEMLCTSEEIFGPVSPLIKFKTEAEAIQIANNTQYGLASYFYSRDIGRIFRVAEALEYGMVGINEGILSTEIAPFGGIKESGIGREGSKYGIEDYIEIKYLCLGGILN